MARVQRFGNLTLVWRFLLLFAVVSTTAAGPFTSLAVGSSASHTCGLSLADPSSGTGTANCWGNNQDGQLGDNTTIQRNVSVFVSTYLVASFLGGSLVAGESHTCGLAASGAAYCWGSNQFGQLGDGSGRSQSTPSAVNMSLVTPFFGRLAAGWRHTCGLSVSGAAYCWGYNLNGQLGFGSVMSNRNVPVAVIMSVVTSFIRDSLIAGGHHTCGIAASGAAFCWGHNGYGQLGQGTISQYDQPSSAVDQSLVGAFVNGSLVAGFHHTCGLSASGVAYCWGRNIEGQLGDGTSPSRKLSPAAVSMSLVGTFLGGSLAAGRHHTCGLIASGVAYCWGENTYGQLGDGTTMQRNTPVAVNMSLVGAFVANSLVAGWGSTCGLSLLGLVYCWGDNSNGQLGDNTTRGSLYPVAVNVDLPFGTLSCTPSISQSLSATHSPSPTASQSCSQSPSTSPSATSTQFMTSSQTRTASRSGTMSCSSSSTQTQTSSGRESASDSPTPSQTGTSTHSASTSQTLSSTQTPSLTQWPTSSQANTRTSSESQLPSDTMTPSATRSPTQFLSMLQSASQSQITSTSPTQSQIATTSMTRSSTATLTASRAPYALLMALHSSVTSVIAVADSVSSEPITFALNRCPSDIIGELTAALSCFVSPAGPLRLPDDEKGASVAIYQSLVSSAPTLVGPISCDPSSDAPVTLGVTNTIGAYFGSASGEGKLTCRVTYTTTPFNSSPAWDPGVLAMSTLPVSVKSTLWPAWDDAIIVTDFGLMRSRRLGYAFNGSETLLWRTGSADVAEALRNLTAVLEGARSAFESIPLPVADVNVLSASSTFSMTLTGSTIIVLRATQTAFRAGTTARLGSGMCAGMAVSDDGRWMVLRTPPANGTCALESLPLPSTAECGYVTFVVNTSVAEQSGSDSLGVVLPCPPFCPGALTRRIGGSSSGDTVPAPLSDGTLGFATNPVVFGSALPPSVPAARTQSSGSSSSVGIYYAHSCSQAGIFTDPTIGACSNASDPSSTNCAYGAGELCRLCPSAALCPGGFRMWPRAGFWAAYDATETVLPCAVPNPEVHCTGWSVALGSTSCGTGYLQGSYICGTCAPEYFLQDDGTCRACPVLISAWDRYHNLVYILCVIAGIVGIVWIGLLLLVRLRGGTLLGGATRMLDLFVWGLLCAQVVSNSAIVSSPTLMPMLVSFFRVVVVLQFEGILVPPACTGAYPFESEVSLMAFALFAWVLCVAVYLVRCAFARLYHVGTLNVAVTHCGRAALTMALVLYSSSASAAVSLLNCSMVSVSVQSLAALDGGTGAAHSSQPTTALGTGVSWGASRGTVVAVNVLQKNPYFVCWEGSHRAAGILAAATVVLYIAALPVVLLGWAWRDPWLRAKLRQPAAEAEDHKPGPSGCNCGRNRKADAVQVAKFAQDNPFQRVSAAKLLSQDADPIPDRLLLPILGDYVPAAWYTKLADVLLLLVLALFRALIPRPSTAALIVTKAAISSTLLLAFCVHVLLVRPFAPPQDWKCWVRALFLVDSAGCALLNAAVSALDAELGGSQLRVWVPVGSYILIVMTCVTLGVLLWRFAVSMYADADIEKRAQVEVISVPPLHPLHRTQETPGAQVLVPSPPWAPSDVASPSRSALFEHPTRCASNPIRRRGHRARSHSRLVTRYVTALNAASGDPEAARRACVALQNALRNAISVAHEPLHGDGVQKSMLGEWEVASAVSALSGALVRYAAHASVAQVACEGLLASTECNYDNVHAQTAMSSALVDALRIHGSSNHQLSRVACGTLSAIAASATGAEAVVKAGGVIALVGVLQVFMARRHHGSPAGEDKCEGAGEATFEACKALAELSQHEDTVQRLADKDVVEALLGVLASAISTLRHDHTTLSSSTVAVTMASFAAQALASATVHNDAVHCFISLGGASTLVALLSEVLHAQQRSRPTTIVVEVSHSSAVCRLLDEEQLKFIAALDTLANHVADTMLSLSLAEYGTVALCKAGAIRPLLEAITVARTDAAGNVINVSPNVLALWEAVCWTLRRLARDGKQLRALAEAGAALTLTTMLSILQVARTCPESRPAPGADSVAEHANAILGALQVTIL